MKCNICNGTGTVKEINCNGCGCYDIRYEDCENDGACPADRIEDEDCRKCNGTGEIPD